MFLKPYVFKATAIGYCTEFNQLKIGVILSPETVENADRTDTFGVD